ncbi:hypothetical protein [Tissierella sp. Yu-01]|uniref:hypothetical protein n=1 Tax=Tissierella sp. Yu-01 TaxID=3035694 RepID=UPI00240E098B|nr:hypothetical protein [Tissierella sp. Yu-01]WFA09592.1 hypothetical protein P3962_03290 [Tissierella sp. Yu-01]
MEYLATSLMILVLLFGFKVFDLIEGRVNSLLLTLIVIISYSFIMNKLFEMFEWRAIVLFFIPSIAFWLRF